MSPMSCSIPATPATSATEAKAAIEANQEIRVAVLEDPHSSCACRMQRQLR